MEHLGAQVGVLGRYKHPLVVRRAEQTGGVVREHAHPGQQLQLGHCQCVERSVGTGSLPGKGTVTICILVSLPEKQVAAA